jgi:molybdenum cofactor guanylyltransferase
VTERSHAERSHDHDRITGVILCGGEGSRLSGRDKPLELINGTPLVGHVHGRLAPQVARVIVSCNRNERLYASWGDQVVHDAAPGGGPLAGILAALTDVSTELAFVCPGDAPLLPTDLVARLASGMNTTTTIVIPHDGERTQHLFMLLRRSARAPLVDFFVRGGRSVHAWIATQPHCAIDAADLASGFFNVNTWGDLASVARAIGRGTTREAAHTR